MWEYTTVAWTLRSGSSDAFLAEMADLGRDGWEAVGICPAPTSAPAYMVLLKRLLA